MTALRGSLNRQDRGQWAAGEGRVGRREPPNRCKALSRPPPE